MTEKSNEILAKLIKGVARGATVTQDELINLGLIMSRESGSQQQAAQPPVMLLAAPGLHGNVHYSSSRGKLTDEESAGVANQIHGFMLQNRIVKLEVCLDPWSQVPVQKDPAG